MNGVYKCTSVGPMFLIVCNMTAWLNKDLNNNPNIFMGILQGKTNEICLCDEGK